MRRSILTATEISEAFQFTHPGRGATRSRNRSSLSSTSFNSRTPGGVRPPAPAVGATAVNVSIHAPREGCDQNQVTDRRTAQVSIHAPREGCDTKGGGRSKVASGFQFTHPGRGATGLTRVESKFYTWFQFTHPGRGATPNQSAREYELTVSIHAPREGCDRARWRIVVRPSSFQFTHPGRGATQR